MYIPVGKSTQQPAHAMHIKASSNDGNVEIVENLECQLGTSTEWYNEYVCLCHGDLGTQECHNVTTFSCSIKHNSRNHLQWLVTIPGVFHIQMAAVDAIWRLHIKGEGLCSNEGGTYKLFEYLCPHDSMKLSTNPTYHMLNDGIHHLLRAHLSVCWEEVMGKDLHEFADREPAWDEIKDLAQKILN